MAKKDIGDQNPAEDQELDLEDEDQDEDEEDLEDDDQDDDENEDDDDDEDEKPSRKNRGTVSPADIKAIKETLRDLKDAAKKGDAVDQKKVKRVDQQFQSWLSEGKTAKDLAPLYQLMEALKEDLREEYEEADKGKQQTSLKERSWEAMDRAFEKIAKKNPSIRWSKLEMTQRAFESMSTGKRYADVRETYTRGRVPADRHYEEALLRQVAVFEKETGKSSGAKKETPASLDLKNSQIRGKSSAVRDGEVDLEKLDHMERQIYTTTLNITKNKKLALEALKDLRGKL